MREMQNKDLQLHLAQQQVHCTTNCVFLCFLFATELGGSLDGEEKTWKRVCRENNLFLVGCKLTCGLSSSMCEVLRQQQFAEMTWGDLNHAGSRILE